MELTVEKPRYRIKAGSERSLMDANPRVSASYFKNDTIPIVRGWQPQLRSAQEDISEAWLKAAGRAMDMYQNSGFIRGLVEVTTGAVVGQGLRMSSRPDIEALGWSEEQGRKWSADFERHYRSWARKAINCDAGGQMTHGQQQQALFCSYVLTGEGLGFAPMVERTGSKYLTKTIHIPSARLVNYTSVNEGWFMGVQTDGYGFPLMYRIQVMENGNWIERDFAARDNDGRQLVYLFKDPIVGSSRNITGLAPLLKVMRQYDQVFDAVVTKKLTQAVFAAALKSNVEGVSAFDGLFTDKDKTNLNTTAFAGAKGEWYDGAKLDLTQHGRVAHLFPGDELQFIESTGQGELQDKVNEWLLRELCQGFGVMYETGTGDFRGATYSSIRMGGAIEWNTTMRRRVNIVVPYCDMTAEMLAEELVGRGIIDYPGGYKAFKVEKEFACKTHWIGPARPQADDYKTAKAFEVRKSMGATTLAEIEGDYGNDWDDGMRQRAAENALAEKMNLPLPWAPTTLLETSAGQEAELSAVGNSDPTSNPNKKLKPSGVPRDPGNTKDSNASLTPRAENLELQLSDSLLSANDEPEIALQINLEPNNGD